MAMFKCCVFPIVATAIIILYAVFKIFKTIFSLLEEHSFFRNLSGFPGNGHWFFGHTLDIKKLGRKVLFNIFPSYFKFSNGLWNYRICCYDPILVRNVLENSDKAVDRIPIDKIILRGPSIGTRSMGPHLKYLRTIFHMCYGMHSKQHFIKIFREVSHTCLDNLGLAKNQCKILEINSLLSEITFGLPHKIWFGDLNHTLEQRLLALLKVEYCFDSILEIESTIEYCWNKMYKIMSACKHRQAFVSQYTNIVERRKNMWNGKDSEKRNSQSILDKLIILELNGEISLTSAQSASLYVSHLTFIQSMKSNFVWLIKCLADNRVWQNKIQEEIKQMKLNGFFYGDKLRLEKFQDLHKFVLETLRMYPAEMITRTVTKSFHFDGHEFPVGTLIDIDLKLHHRNPLFWEYPDKFIPERFSKENKRNSYEFVPFSAGQRICPSKNFIMTAMKTFAITFVERLDFDAVIPFTNDEEFDSLRPIKITSRAE